MTEALTQEAIGTESLTEAEVFTLTIEGGADARRLDQWLVGQLPELTRSRIQSLAKAGHLTDQDGRAITKLSAAPQPGMTLILTLPPAEPVDIIPEDIPLDILYEDEDLIALNKPAGLVVHPACGHSHGTLVNALLYHCPDLKGIGGRKTPRHRASSGHGHLGCHGRGQTRTRPASLGDHLLNAQFDQRIPRDCPWRTQT